MEGPEENGQDGLQNGQEQGAPTPNGEETKEQGGNDTKDIEVNDQEAVEIDVQSVLDENEKLKAKVAELESKNAELSDELAEAEKAVKSTAGSGEEVAKLKTAAENEKKRANDNEVKRKRTEQEFRAFKLDVKNTLNGLFNRHKIGAK